MNTSNSKLAHLINFTISEKLMKILWRYWSIVISLIVFLRIVFLSIYDYNIRICLRYACDDLYSIFIRDFSVTDDYVDPNATANLEYIKLPRPSPISFNRVSCQSD